MTAAPGDQEGLVGPGHLDPGHDQQHEQQHQNNDAADGDQDGHASHFSSVGVSNAVETTSTEVALGVPMTYTGVPTGSEWADFA